MRSQGEHLDLWETPLSEWVEYATDFDDAGPYEYETDIRYTLRILFNISTLMAGYRDMVIIPVDEREDLERGGTP